MKSVATGKISVLGRSSFVLHRAYTTSLKARDSATARAALCVALFLLIFVGGSVLFLVHTKPERAALALSRKAGAGMSRSDRGVGEEQLPTAPRSASQQLAELLSGQAEGGGGQHQGGEAQQHGGQKLRRR